MANPTSKKLTVSNAVQYYGTGLKNAQKALSTRYLESSIVISIHSLLPENMQSSGSKYDYKSGIEIYLKYKTAKALSKITKKARNYIAEDSEFEPMAVPSGANLIEVSDGSKFNLKKSVTIAIYSDIDANKKTETYDVFQFLNDKVLTGYDKDEGTYNEMYMDTDIEYFIDQLNDFARCSSNAEAHFLKKEISFDLGRLASRQLQIMDKLGIQSNDFRFNKGTDWVNRQNQQKPESSSSMNTDDMMAELDNM